jgi:membrane protein DedA with SNARE-associated domain
VGNFVSIVIKGIGIFLGALLLVLGGWIGVENWQAPGTINISIMVFSVAAILVGSLFLWLAFRKDEKT